MTATWGIHHKRHGFIAATTVQMFYADPIYVRLVNGTALFNTRTTARVVLYKLIANDVPVSGYTVKRAAVKVEVVK